VSERSERNPGIKSAKFQAAKRATESLRP